jgi:hypothetical protein
VRERATVRGAGTAAREEVERIMDGKWMELAEGEGVEW